jgi:hypothetical protein
MAFTLPALAALALAACAHSPPPAGHDASAGVTTTSATVPGQNDLFESPSDEAKHPTPYHPVEVPPVDAWAWNYPDAAMELGQWELGNPETARALAKWQRLHPEKMEALVDWSVTHLYEPLGAFLMDRTGWSELQAIAAGSDELHGFIGWIRRAPVAARELAVHTDGLAFANEHAEALSKMTRAEALMHGHVASKVTTTSATVPAAPIAPKNDDNMGGSGIRSPTGPVD